MNINSLPENILYNILEPFPLSTIVKSGQVCQRWRSVKQKLCLTRSSLVLLIGEDSLAELLTNPWAGGNRLKDIRQDDGSPLVVDALARNLEEDSLQLAIPHFELNALLLETFPRISELVVVMTTIPDNFMPFFDLRVLINLLELYSPMLTTLKLSLKQHLSIDSHLFAVINGMPQLKHLALNFHSARLDDFDLPLLSQLESFQMFTDNFDLVKRLLRPCTKNYSPKLQISIDSLTLWDSRFCRIKAQVAALFTRIPLVQFDDLTYLERFVTRFTSLVDLTFEALDLSIPQLLEAIARLPALVSLSMTVIFKRNFAHTSLDDIGRLSQVHSVKWLTLVQEASSHADFSRWNFGRTFPNLQVLQMTVDMRGCTDCGYLLGNCSSAQVSKCLRGLLHSVKSQCPHLHTGYIKTRNGVRCDIEQTT